MKKFLISTIVLLCSLSSYSQRLSQVTFADGANLSYFSFLTEQDVLIRISADGNILEWGTEVMADRFNYYHPSLQPFMGRVEYYGAESDSIFKGKIKSIGSCMFSYYGAYEKDKAGKLRSVGTTYMDYYSEYDDKLLRGKLKFIGNLAIGYYNSFDDEALRGKLKSIGITTLTYNSIFDDKINAGKIKTIGGIAYSWYSTFDRSDLRGALKTGLPRQMINGITYIVRQY
jgi:hypothetical protein